MPWPRREAWWAARSRVGTWKAGGSTTCQSPTSFPAGTPWRWPSPWAPTSPPTSRGVASWCSSSPCRPTSVSSPSPFSHLEVKAHQPFGEPVRKKPAAKGYEPRVGSHRVAEARATRRECTKDRAGHQSRAGRLLQRASDHFLAAHNACAVRRWARQAEVCGFVERGTDVSRLDQGDCDAEGCQLHAQGLREGIHRGFGGGVVGLEGNGRAPREGTHEHDAPRAAASEVGQDGAHAGENAEHIGFELLVRGRKGDLLNAAEDAETGIAHQRVEVSRALAGECKAGAHGLFSAHVHLDPVDPGLGCPGRATARAEDPPAATRQERGRGGTNAGAGAGDERRRAHAPASTRSGLPDQVQAKEWRETPSKRPESAAGWTKRLSGAAPSRGPVQSWGAYSSRRARSPAVSWDSA